MMGILNFSFLWSGDFGNLPEKNKIFQNLFKNNSINVSSF